MISKLKDLLPLWYISPCIDNGISLLDFKSLLDISPLILL
jgi:hypothetical protein